MPRSRALYENEMVKFGKSAPHFRGIYMKDKLPDSPLRHESGVLNLDNSNGTGTHWTAYTKTDNVVRFFDSFGDLKPPLEFLWYMRDCSILYNYERYQKYDTTNCGQLCLRFLHSIIKPRIWKTI